MTPLLRPEYPRCVCDVRSIRAKLPRGRVRREDLSTLHVEVGMDAFDTLRNFEPRPHVDVRYGGERIARLPLDADAWGTGWSQTVPVGEAVLKELQGLRGRISWGRFDAKDHQAIAAVWLDPPSAGERTRLAALRRALRAEEPWIQQVLEAQLLFDQTFDQAALRLARSVLGARPAEAHATAILHAAYEYLGLRLHPAARAHGIRVVLPLREARRSSRRRCHLDDDGSSLRQRRRERPRACGKEAARSDGPPGTGR